MQGSGGPVVLPDSSREEGRGGEGGEEMEGGEEGRGGKEREGMEGRGGERRGEEGREERRGRGWKGEEGRGEEGREWEGREEEGVKRRVEEDRSRRGGSRGMCKYRNLHTYCTHVLPLAQDSVRILINSLWCSTLAAVIGRE